MSPEAIFRTQLVFGYVAWLLCFATYIGPRLRSMDHVEAQRAIATLHSFRFSAWSLSCPATSGPIFRPTSRPSPRTGIS